MRFALSVALVLAVGALVFFLARALVASEAVNDDCPPGMVAVRGWGGGPVCVEGTRPR